MSLRDFPFSSGPIEKGSQFCCFLVISNDRVVGEKMFMFSLIFARETGITLAWFSRIYSFMNSAYWANNSGLEARRFSKLKKRFWAKERESPNCRFDKSHLSGSSTRNLFHCSALWWYQKFVRKFHCHLGHSLGLLPRTPKTLWEGSPSFLPFEWVATRAQPHGSLEERIQCLNRYFSMIGFGFRGSEI